MSPGIDHRVEMLEWIARVGPVSADALAVRADLAPAAARSRLGAAVRRGELVRSAPLREVPPSYELTRVGMRAVGLRGAARPPVTAASAAHAYTCSLVAAHLELRYDARLAVGERAVHDRGAPRPAGLECRLGLLSARGGRMTHRADLVLEGGPSEGSIAVEIELTVKAHARLVDICRAWARCRAVRGVLYVASQPAERAVRHAIAEANAAERIAVVPLASLLAPR